MSNRILQFVKTDHFMLSQWKRGVYDDILYKILPYVEDIENDNKSLLFVSPKFLKKKDIKKKKDEILVIVLKEKKVLVTTYWGIENEIFLLANKEKAANFQIIN